MIDEGASGGEVAERWGVSKDSVKRHIRNHRKDRQIAKTVAAASFPVAVASSQMAFMDRVYHQQDVLHSLQAGPLAIRDHVAIQRSLLGLYTLEAQVRGLMVKPRENEERLRSAVEAIRLYLTKYPKDKIDEVIAHVAKSRRLDPEMLKAAMESHD